MWVPAFITVWSKVLWWVSRSFGIIQTSLLCLPVLMLLIIGMLHLLSKWTHVSGWLRWHVLDGYLSHVNIIYCPYIGYICVWECVFWASVHARVVHKWLNGFIWGCFVCRFASWIHLGCVLWGGIWVYWYQAPLFYNELIGFPICV